MFTVIDYLEDEQGNIMDAQTGCVFDPQQAGNQLSMVLNKAKSKFLTRRNTDQTQALLKHEQGHADICWLSALATGRAILKNMHSAKSIIENHNNIQKKLHKLYDKETEHSKNIQNQKKWDCSFDVAITHRRPHVLGHLL